VSPTGFYTIPANVDRSLELMAEQFLSPAFPQAELDLQKTEQLAGLEQAKEDPSYIASRIVKKNLYGKDHPYAREVTVEDINSITRDDIVQFYKDYYRPPNIKVVVAGDITPAQAVAKLNRVFGDLKPGKQGDLKVPPVAPTGSTTIYLYDRPGSPQSVISVAHLGPQRDTPDQYAIDLMNTALGGAFNSRLNLNLREQHQYAYGAGSGFNFRRPPEPSTFAAMAQVVTAKTDSSLIEVMKEINGIRGTKMVTPDEMTFAKGAATKALPLQFETIGQRASAVAGLVANDQPLDYYNTVIQKYESVTLDQMQAAAKKYLTPDKMVIVVVGDRKTIEPGLKAANIAPVVVVDTF
jgi:zinc protease